MENLSLYTLINNLPAHVKQEVRDFVESLKKKTKKDEETPKNRQFGVLKGKISMSKDFDEPLTDFKKYM
ncbi:type II toxin-antitoxin system VapB family antitoxin [Roseivirga thermotolerans]|uniref:DUF2281 domain-containing protein n=1 Tax=Roseivirga thermotolerans TaxID=1758176 RepID=A0ABQ3IBA5_9BACT|nr:DUF2281 domain-containing protein [Roseivirga thermotolerans]GHE72834.1 hypothetical protein GCM10011340_31620 [Roseivirga thermotolerans]